MGQKYRVWAKRNGYCISPTIEKITDSKWKAVYWYIVLSCQFKIVHLEQRTGFDECSTACDYWLDCPTRPV